MQEAPDIPRMIGEADLHLALSLAARLPADATLLEFGPWLGGVTRHLARHGEVHVVDRFIWSEQNDTRLPDRLAPGADFRPLFDAEMAAAGARVTVHATEIARFRWRGGQIHYAFIDLPRAAGPLLECLRPIAADLRPGAPVLVKHGANPDHPEMLALIHHLLAEGYVTLDRIGQPAWCNIAVLRATARTAELAALDWSPELLSAPPARWDIPDPWGGAIFAAARLALAVDGGDWPLAHALLDSMPPDRHMLEAWDRQEARLTPPDSDAEAFHRFGDLVSLHHDPLGHAAAGPADLARSVPAAIGGAWRLAEGTSWRGKGFHSAAIARAHDAGAFAGLARLGIDPRGRHVIAAGEDLAAFGVAVMAAEAASFLGLVFGETHRTDGTATLIGPAALAPFRSAALYADEAFDLAILPALDTQPLVRHERIARFRDTLPAE
jgi:hypothetical protein